MMPERIRIKRYGQMMNQLNKMSIGESASYMETVYTSINEAINPNPNVSQKELGMVVKRDTNGNYLFDENDKPIYELDSNKKPKLASGGIVIFSTDVSASNQSLFGKIQATITNITVKSKLVSIINKIINDDYSVEANHPQVKYTPIKGYTLKKGMRGRWFDTTTGDVFDESSYAIEIIGIDTFVLMAFADSMRVALNQQSVLVIDYNQNNAPFFVNIPEKIAPRKTSLSEKISWKIYDVLMELLNRPDDEYYIEKNRKYKETHPTKEA